MNTRRKFLASAAATAAVATIPLVSACSAGTQKKTGKDADVIVVGGGVSGLNTAWLLEEQGLKVMLIEGRKRFGGRVYTLFDEPGYPEMGFNTFGAGYGRGLDAARRSGLNLVDLTPRLSLGREPSFFLDGKLVPYDQWPTHPANPFPERFRTVMPWMLAGKLVTDANPLKDWMGWTSPDNAPLDVSMYEFLKAQGLDDKSIALAFDTAPYHGDTAKNVSALMYEFGDGWGKSQFESGPESFGIEGGNQQLPEAMARMLKGDVLKGVKIVSASSDASGASVTSEDGRTFRADRVVMTLPFSTLRHVKFDPGLPAPQRKAMDELGYQAISIMFVRVNSPFWEEDKLDPSMWTNSLVGTVSAQRFGKTVEEVTGLMVQTRGMLARKWDAMPEAELKRQVIAELESLRPAAKGKISAAHVHRWALEPFNQGDWAFWKPGQITSFAETMALPAGRIHFAGEHTATGNRGLEAAFESSERVALEILSV